MKTSIVSFSFDIPVDAAITILRAPKPEEAMRAYVEKRFNADSTCKASVTNYDIETLRKDITAELGRIALEKALGTTITEAL